MRRPRLLGTLAAALFAFALAAPVAAAPGDSGALQLAILDDSGTPAAGQAWVRVLHGSPDAPEVDVYVGADLASAAKVDALSGLSFAEHSDYVPVPAGTYAVKVCATADATICPIEVAALAVADGKKYTVVASNALADIEANVLEDGTAAVGGKGQVRVAHFSADTPAVDVLTQDKATAVVDGAPYKANSGYLPLDPGSYDLIICADADNTICPLDPGPIAVTADTEVTVYAIGSLTTLLATTTTDTEPATSPFALLIVLAGAALTLLGVRRFASVRASR